jgi:hypothetical protein
MADVKNPWMEEFWSLTAQGAYIKQYGFSVASRKAKLAGSFIGALRPKQVAIERVIERQWIITKRVGSGSGGGAPSADDAATDLAIALATKV